MGARPAMTKGYNRHYFVSDHAVQRARERVTNTMHNHRGDADLANLLDETVWQSSVLEENVQRVDDIDGPAQVIDLADTVFDGLFAVVHEEQKRKHGIYTHVIRTLLTKEQMENNRAVRWNNNAKGLNSSLKDKLAPLVELEQRVSEKKEEPVPEVRRDHNDLRVLVYADRNGALQEKLCWTQAEVQDFIDAMLAANSDFDLTAVEVLKPTWAPVKKKLKVEFEE